MAKTKKVVKINDKVAKTTKPKTKANEKNMLHSAFKCNNCSFVKL